MKDPAWIEKRLSMLSETMAARGIDACVVGPSSDLLYLCGYRAMALERLTALVLTPEGEPLLLVPELEAGRVPRETEVVCTITTWADGEDAYDLCARKLRGRERIAVDDRLYAFHLLELRNRLGEVVFERLSELTSPLRSVKDEVELASLRRAASSADAVAERLVDLVEPGISEREVAERIRQALLDTGHDTVEFVIVASGPNSASPHHEPGSRVLGRGDVVVCDFGGTLEGYCSDITRTVVLGEVPAGLDEIYAVVALAQEKAVTAVRPGIAAAEVDDAARSVIREAGLGEHFVHRTGHGIGIDVHEEPYVVATNRAPILPGMTFSIEPGVYFPGRWGVRIEDIVVCGTEGGERLNRAGRELTIV